MTSSPESDEKFRGGVRQAAIANSSEDVPLGACLYLTVENLRALGVDAETADAITYEVDEETSQLHIEAVDGESGR